MRQFVVVSALLAALLASPVMAGKLYKWVDEKGNVHYSDKVPPEASKLARKEMNQEGVTVRKVDRAKTQEELAAEAAQKERDIEAAKVAKAQAQADSALMMSFNTEDDLQRALEQELNVIDANISTSRLTMASQEKNLSELLAHAADYERNKKPVPADVAASIATVRTQIEAQQKSLAEREASKNTVRKDFAAKLVRWRELTAKPKTGAAATPASAPTR
jgi:predicted Zn-dependent peptidase